MAEPALRYKDRSDRAIEGFEALVKISPEGLSHLAVMVDGAHCAACIGKIESRLAKEQDVRTARLNFSTRRLNIEWEGMPGRANDFAAAIESLGYKVHPFDQHTLENSDEDKFLLLCLGVAGFALGNIMLLSVGLWTSNQQTMGIETRDFLHWMSAIIALPTILFSGRPFFRSAFHALSSRTTNMDVPISVALVLTSGMSLFETFQHGEHAYFDSVVMLMFFLLVGRYLDFRARRHARRAAGELLGAITGFAYVQEADGNLRRLPVSALSPGMILRVPAGEKIPADGILIDGQSSIDMALVTGETLPADIHAGSRLYAGTINLSAPLTMRVMKAADDTLLSDIIRLMEKAQQAQAQYVRIADRVARAYTPLVHILAVAAFIGWLAAGLAWQKSLLIAATVLIITCPCALALAVPVVQVLATGKLFRSGILVKSGDALERLAEIDTILLDKTGTLTLGYPELQHAPDPQLLPLAASVASYSSHPLSRALSRAYKGPLVQLSEVKEYPGQGIEAKYDGKTLRLGRREWCNVREVHSRGMEMWLAFEGSAPVQFLFSDEIRGDAHETLKALKMRGLNMILISGDREESVSAMAQAAGIEEFHSSMTPVQKAALLEDLKKQGQKILMVGDGLNDAPALAGADVSISPSTASDLAQNAADIIFMGEGLKPLLISFETALFSQTLVKQNFSLAVVYNIFAIPLAMAGFVTPLIAALAMSGSSLVVVANSFRLRYDR